MRDNILVPNLLNVGSNVLGTISCSLHLLFQLLNVGVVLTQRCANSILENQWITTSFCHDKYVILIAKVFGHKCSHSTEKTKYKRSMVNY